MYVNKIQPTKTLCTTTNSVIYQHCKTCPIKPSLYFDLNIPPNSLCNLHILWHDSHSFCIHHTKIHLLKQPHQEGFPCLLEGHDHTTLEPQIFSMTLDNFPYHPLEGEPADQKICTFLAFLNFLKSHHPRLCSLSYTFTAFPFMTFPFTAFLSTFFSFSTFPSISLLASLTHWALAF